VDPIKPTLKAPVTQRLKLKYVNCFQFCLNFAFNFNLRRYTLAASSVVAPYASPTESFAVALNAADWESESKVGRCRLKPVFASTEQDALRLGSVTQPPVCDTL